MADLTSEDINALVAQVKELTKDIDRKFICQTLICAAGDLLIEQAACKHMNCLQGNADNLHLLLDAHLKVAAIENNFTGIDPLGLFEQFLESSNTAKTNR